MRKRTLLAAALAVLPTTAAFADPTCTTEPREKWMSEAAFQEMAVKEHRISEVRKFEVTDTNCYEIYGFRDGKQVEIYFDPVTGKVVQEGD
jgi:hypothetical protein